MATNHTQLNSTHISIVYFLSLKSDRSSLHHSVTVQQLQHFQIRTRSIWYTIPYVACNTIMKLKSIKKWYVEHHQSLHNIYVMYIQSSVFCDHQLQCCDTNNTTLAQLEMFSQSTVIFLEHLHRNNQHKANSWKLSENWKGSITHDIRLRRRLLFKFFHW